VGDGARRLSRAVAFAAAVLSALLAVGGASGSGTVKPRIGGTVVVAWPGGGDPVCLGSQIVWRCNGTIEPFAVPQVLEGAFEIGPDLTYRPNLVSRVTVKRAPFTLTYNIKPRARWSDGVPVTADDFVFTYEKREKAFWLLSPVSGITVRSARALDAKRFQIVFESRFADWRDLFAVVLPRHALAGEDLEKVWNDAIVNPKTGRPLGSGPFLVERFERGRQLVLARNPRYWGPHKARLDRVVFRLGLIGFNRQIEALRAGGVDAVGSHPAPEGLPALRRDRRFRVVAEPGLLVDQVQVRLGPGGHPLLRNRLIRRALAYGLDREALVRRAYGELDPTLKPLQSAIYLPNSRFYKPNWSRYRHRPAEARRLLASAGCRRGVDGIYSCGRERLSLRLATTAGRREREQMVQLAQAQLARIGVEIRPVYAPSSTFFPSMLFTGDFDLALFSVGTIDPSLWVRIHSCGGGLNRTAYCDRQVTRDLHRTDQILDPRARAALFNKIDRQLARDLPLLPPLGRQPAYIVYRRTLRGVIPNAAESFTWSSEDWWIGR
jgi:peptide/nickel transport system substrate-binding protein